MPVSNTFGSVENYGVCMEWTGTSKSLLIDVYSDEMILKGNVDCVNVSLPLPCHIFWFNNIKLLRAVSSSDSVLVHILYVPFENQLNITVVFFFLCNLLPKE